MALAWLLSAEVASKVLVLAVLFTAAVASYQAVPLGDRIPRLAASVLYVLNPFVYGRLHYGQFILLAGYAVLPWLAMQIYRLIEVPDLPNALRLAAGVGVVAVLALHLLLPVSLLLAISVVAGLVHVKRTPESMARLGRALLLTTGATLVGVSYWLVPYISGRSYESALIARVTAGDLSAYRSVPDPSLGLFPNLAGLYGFWAENVHRFPSLKLFVPGWEFVLIGLLVLAAVGAAFVFFARDESFRRLRWWVLTLVVTGLVSLVLEAGVAEPHIAPFIRWLDAVFPPYRGMRDSGKWASILALVYAQLIPLGFIALRDGLVDLFENRTLREGGRTIVASLALALPLYYGNGLLFGMHGEIQPSAYPAGWYAADRVMVEDRQHERALFLPWHLYLRLSFVRNVNSVIANPAPGFFSIPTVVSADPEVPGIAPPASEDQRAVQALIKAGGGGDWGHVLASHNIKYVVLAKELDWENFHYLDQQAGLRRVADYGSVVLYRVMANN